MNPQPVTDLDMAFGGNIDKLLPSYNTLPKDFIRGYSPWCQVVSQWFYKGLDAKSLMPKDDIDKTAAFRHLKAVMGSWEPKHEHKIAGVAYLMSLWFEPVTA